MAADGDPLSPDAVESLRSGLTRRIDRSVVIQGATEDHSEEKNFNRLLKVAASMVHAEQEELIRMRDEDGLPDAIARPMLRDLDAREHALERKYR
jgi:hypothetical protein